LKRFTIFFLIFFSCALAKFMWSQIRAILNVSWNPSYFMHFFQIISPLSHNHRWQFEFYLRPRAERHGIFVIRLLTNRLTACLKLGKICYITALFFIVYRNTQLNCVFARTHRIIQNGKFGTFSSKPLISNKSAKLSIFGTTVCSDKYVTKL
jgi:hypothetical protein